MSGPQLRLVPTPMPTVLPRLSINLTGFSRLACLNIKSHDDRQVHFLPIKTGVLQSGVSLALPHSSVSIWAPIRPPTPLAPALATRHPASASCCILRTPATFATSPSTTHTLSSTSSLPPRGQLLRGDDGLATGQSARHPRRFFRSPCRTGGSRAETLGAF